MTTRKSGNKIYTAAKFIAAIASISTIYTYLSGRTHHEYIDTKDNKDTKRILGTSSISRADSFDSNGVRPKKARKFLAQYSALKPERMNSVAVQNNLVIKQPEHSIVVKAKGSSKLESLVFSKSDESLTDIIPEARLGKNELKSRDLSRAKARDKKYSSDLIQEYQSELIIKPLAAHHSNNAQVRTLSTLLYPLSPLSPLTSARILSESVVRPGETYLDVVKNGSKESSDVELCASVASDISDISSDASSIVLLEETKDDFDREFPPLRR